MFDFLTSLTGDQLRDEASALLIDALAPLDTSVDPLLFEEVPLNRVTLP